MSRLTQLFSYTSQVKSYSANTTLTSSDTRKVTQLIPASNSLFVTLPQGNTLPTSVDTLRVANATKFNVPIRDYDGTLLCTLGATGSLDLHLTANNTSAGSWATGSKKNLSDTVPVEISSVTNTLTDASSIWHIIAVSSTTLVIFYSTSGNATKVVAATISGETLTYGTAVTLNASGTGYIRSTLLGNTVLFCYYSSTAGKMVFSSLTVSGTTITKGSDTTPSFTIGTGIRHYDIAIHDAANSRGTIIYYTGSAGDTYAAVFTFSGGTFTFGSSLTLINNINFTSGGYCQVVPYNATTAYIFYSYSDASSVRYMRLGTFSISGTAITQAGFTTIYSTSSTNNPSSGIIIPDAETFLYHSSFGTPIMYGSFTFRQLPSLNEYYNFVLTNLDTSSGGVYADATTFLPWTYQLFNGRYVAVIHRALTNTGITSQVVRVFEITPVGKIRNCGTTRMTDFAAGTNYYESAKTDESTMWVTAQGSNIVKRVAIYGPKFY